MVQGSEPGRAVLAEVDERLQLFMVVQDSESGQPVVEVVAELSKFCRIDDQEHSILLTHILMEQNEENIEDELQRRRIRFEPAGPSEADPSEDGLGTGKQAK